MAEYTITISDTENGVLFNMRGTGSRDSGASKLALAVMAATEALAKKLAKECQCDKCRAARSEQPVSAKDHTVH
ncbi:hypothetical protein D3C78_1149040 [compost metagenome]